MASAIQPVIWTLLAQVGSCPPGPHRASCPDCGGRRTVNVDEAKGVFYCHRAGCGFQGGIGTLRKRLGIGRELLPRAEYVRQQQTPERVHSAAEQLAASVHDRRKELLYALHELNRLEALAHKAGPGHPATWGALTLVYGQRPEILVELVILEDARAADLVRFLRADSQARQQAVDSVLCAGGLSDPSGKFIDVQIG
jgi:hypothetical protein